MAIGVIAFVSAAQAANPPPTILMVPPIINYQGRLMTPTNSPYRDAAHKIDLTLYPDAAQGPKLWSEAYTVQTRDGYFSVNLGSTAGTPLLPTNAPLWQVLWNFAGNETNTLFMALTVKTGPDGSDLSSPIESSPRQQFLTAPFAFRAHQSVYARKADGLFDAAQGVQTPSVTTTNAQLALSAGTEVALNRDLRVPTASTIYANKFIPNDTNTTMTIGSGGTKVIGIGAPPYNPPAQPYSGTDVRIYGNTTTLAATNLSIVNDMGSRAPMLVRKSVTVTANTSSTLTTVDPLTHDIDTYTYEIGVVGWYYSATTPTIRGIYTNPSTGYIYIYFTATPTSGSVILHLLAYPKAMTGNW